MAPRKRSRRRKTRRRQRGGANLKYDGPGPIKVFTSSDKMKPTLEALMESLKKHKYSYEVLGMGKPWKGFKTKMENYLEGINRFIAAKGPDAMAIFVDAFDVFCIKDADKVLDSYKAKPRPMPIVVATEIICFYNENCSMDALDWYDQNKIPGGSQAIKDALTQPEPRPYYKSPKPVFLNSGFIMGPANELQALFQGMMDSGDTDDQIAVINYMKNHMDKIDFDIEEAMIRVKLEPRTKSDDEDGTRGPGFLHYPGSRTDDEQKQTLQYYKAYP
jgi:hypothetical protein